MSSSDRALINAFREISNMADRINLPKTIVVCIKLFYYFLKIKLLLLKMCFCYEIDLFF